MSASIVRPEYQHSPPVLACPQFSTSAITVAAADWRHQEMLALDDEFKSGNHVKVDWQTGQGPLETVTDISARGDEVMRS